jgi:hypothetical protein
MRTHVLLATLLLVRAAAAHAGSNNNYLVPAYEPCTPPATSCPAVLASRFTFESAVLKTPNAKYIRDDKVAVTIELKGVRDPTGTLVTTDPGNQADDFRLVIPGTQLTVLGSTYAPGGVFNSDIVLGVDLKNGKGKASYKTPPGGEGSGVVAEAVAIPYVVDSDGNRFAVSGSRDKPPQ